MSAAAGSRRPHRWGSGVLWTSMGALGLLSALAFLRIAGPPALTEPADPGGPPA